MARWVQIGNKLPADVAAKTCSRTSLPAISNVCDGSKQALRRSRHVYFVIESFGLWDTSISRGEVLCFIFPVVTGCLTACRLRCDLPAGLSLVFPSRVSLLFMALAAGIYINLVAKRRTYVCCPFSDIPGDGTKRRAAGHAVVAV